MLKTFFMILLITAAILFILSVIAVLLLSKWRNHYDVYRMADHIMKCDGLQINIYDQITLIDLRLKHINGYLKYQKVISPKTKWYWFLNYVVKHSGIY